MLTTQELADALSLDTRTILRFIKKGLPHMRVGQKVIRYDLKAVSKWLRKQAKAQQTGE